MSFVANPVVDFVRSVHTLEESALFCILVHSTYAMSTDELAYDSKIDLSMVLPSMVPN